MKTKLQIAIEALQDIRTWNEDLNDQWGDPGERAIFALDAIQEESPKRHPSEITPDEFFELAKIVDSTVKNISVFEFKVKQGAISMYSEKRLFEIEHTPVFNFVAFNSSLMESIYYDFQQSLKIAAYLDSIGIEYQPKDSEQ